MRNSILAILFSVLMLPALAQDALDSLLTYDDQELPSDSLELEELTVYIYKHYRTYPELVRKIAEKIHDKSEEIGYLMGQARALRRIGATHYVLGKTSDLIDSQLRAIKVYERMSHSTGIAYCWNNIGLAYLQTEEFEKSRDTFFKALRTSDSADSEFHAVCYNNLSLAYENLQNYDSALYYNNEALKIRLEVHKDPRRLQATYLNLGSLYRKHLDNLELASKYTRESIAINREIKNYVDLSSGYLNLGLILQEQGKSQDAMQSIQQAIQFADSSKDNGALSNAYKAASEIQSTIGNLGASIDYYRQYHDAQQRAIEDKQEVEVRRLENNYLVSEKEKEVAVLRTNQAKQDLIQAYLVATVVITVLLLLVIVQVTRARIRRAKAEQAKLEMELDYKNKELTSYALNFIQKNELIDNFSRQLDEIKRQSDGPITKELGKIGRTLNDSARIDNEWENFRLMFEQVHQGFFTSITKAFPGLGNSELRLCALLRLNLNLKESSRILGISSNSVKTARHRLRKKLGLTRDENLVDFLISFDQKAQSS